MDLARHPSTPRAQALVLVASARAYRNAHAPFLAGELRSLLAYADIAGGGELVDLPKESVSRAIRTAKANGWIAPQSNARCVILREHLHAYGTGRSGSPLCHH